MAGKVLLISSFLVILTMVKGETHVQERVEVMRRQSIQQGREVMEEMSGDDEEEMSGDDEEEHEEDLPTLAFDPQEFTMEVGTNKTIEISLSQAPVECLDVNLTVSNPEVVVVFPGVVVLCNATPTTLLLHASLTHRGSATLTAQPDLVDILEAPSPGGWFSVVSVMYSQGINTLADVLGWLYTIAWDISFLPQIVHNWRRKSVVGLSFDFLTYNFLGFSSYFFFNMGMYWIPEIKNQYAIRNPHSILHVRLNDVIFPLYAVLCTAAQIAQCFVYQRSEGQRVSVVCGIISGLLVVVAVVACILVPLVQDWWWIDVLYVCSYIKLAITCIKYVPQLWINYRSRSTAGWSIYQVILDFTGGSLSLIQMFLLSGNFDDWLSLLTDPAKLGLGLLSILFNILFFIQHYCLYRTPSSETDEKGVDNFAMDRKEMVDSKL